MRYLARLAQISGAVFMLFMSPLVFTGCHGASMPNDDVSLEPLTSPHGRLIVEVDGPADNEVVPLTLVEYNSGIPLVSGKQLSVFKLRSGFNILRNLDLSEGRYGLFVDDLKYHTERAGYVFPVPSNGEYWQVFLTDFTLVDTVANLQSEGGRACGYRGYRASIAAKEGRGEWPACAGGGIAHFTTTRIGGDILGCIAECAARITITRLPNIEGVDYVDSGRSPKELNLAPERVLVAVVDPDLDAQRDTGEDVGEVVAIIDAKGDSWAVNGLAAGARYRVTAETANHLNSPVVYEVSLIGSRSGVTVRDVTFHFGES